MVVSTVAGWLATLLVVFAALGAVVTLVTGPLLGEFGVATVLVTVLVVAAVAVVALQGAKSRRWLYNGGYW